MKLTIAAQRLVDQGVGQMGVTIFINTMPAEVPQGVLLRDTAQGSEINHYLPGYIATGFRVAVRSGDYAAALNLAWRVLTALTLKGETALAGCQVKQMLPLNEPRAYRRSVGGLWEFEIDFSVNYSRDLASTPSVP